MSDRVLVAFDGVEGGRDALALGRAMAKGIGADVLVVEVGWVPAGLTTVIERERPFLTVFGSAHRGRLGRAHLGSVGEALLSGASSPVVVAPLDYANRDQRGLLRVGVGVDGGEEGWAALAAAIDLADRLRARLKVVSVCRPGRYAYGYSVDPATGTDFTTLEERQRSQALAEALTRVPAAIPVDHQMLHGNPAEALSEIAAELDLLVLGSRGYGPVRRVLLGGVSARVMRSAASAVMVVPRGSTQDAATLRPGATDATAAA